MDTSSLVQPGRQLTCFEATEELAGVLELSDRPKMSGGYANIYHGFWTNPQGERVEVAVKELKALIPRNHQTKEDELVMKAEMIYQAGYGLEHLHSRTPPISHADVKPENVLVNDWREAALSDFGLSQVLHGPDIPSGFTTSETVKGTYRYKARELFNGGQTTCSSDVYAFGGLILTVSLRR
ncbi:hypothetical protein FS837_010895 [Tulasnella sp. UAMH 9824]|nr:hypothetical protein FS837_010895 [Tulasnella sp. UAMH 9824]